MTAKWTWMTTSTISRDNGLGEDKIKIYSLIYPRMYKYFWKCCVYSIYKISLFISTTFIHTENARLAARNETRYSIVLAHLATARPGRAPNDRVLLRNLLIHVLVSLSKESLLQLHL